MTVPKDTKLIGVKIDTYNSMHSLGRMGDSYNDVVKKLLDCWYKHHEKVNGIWKEKQTYNQSNINETFDKEKHCEQAMLKFYSNKLSSIELEDTVTELWNSARYKSKADLGRKIGLTGERVGQLIHAKKIRDSCNILLDKSVSTRIIQLTSPLMNDRDRCRFLEISNANKYKPYEIKKYAKIIAKLDICQRQAVLYENKPIEQNFSNEQVNQI